MSKRHNLKNKYTLNVELPFTHYDLCRFRANGSISDSAGESCLHFLGNGAATVLMVHCLLIYANSLRSKSISHYRSNHRSLGSFRLLVGVRFFIIISKWVSFLGLFGFGVFLNLLRRWLLIFCFNSDYSKTRSVLVCSGMIVLFGGLEALLILTLRVWLLVYCPLYFLLWLSNFGW
jgi:hypothetical protein